LANNLNRRATIYARQTLRIPQPGDQMPPLKPGAPTQPADKTDTDDTVRLAESALPANETQKPLSDASERERYPAPVLASILPIAAIAHNEKPDRPQPAIADLEKPNLEIVTADVRFENVLNENGRPVGILQVEVEETLGHYAEWAKVRTHQIRRLNAMRFGDVLHLHQKIKIPLQRTTVQLFEETRYEYHKRLQEDFFAVYRPGELSAYRIERGDSVWTLCRKKFDIPMWLLKHSNPELDLAELRMNQKIWIPTIEKATLDEPLVGDGSEGEDPGTGQAEPEQAEPDQAETEQSELNQVENDEAL
jgi:membrane-bound lytic murein transglycosylase D